MISFDSGGGGYSLIWLNGGVQPIGYGIQVYAWYTVSEKSEFCIKLIGKSDICVRKQDQSLSARATPPYPSICWVPPSLPPFDSWRNFFSS